MFRINTSKSVSKQRTLSSFRMNTFEKQGGGWGECQRPLLPLFRRFFKVPYGLKTRGTYFELTPLAPQFLPSTGKTCRGARGSATPYKLAHTSPATAGARRPLLLQSLRT